MQAVLATLFHRDLTRLHQEIEAYPDEASLWQVAPGISNSAGNLVLHLVGNLSTYLGATLGQTGYVRDRDAEFSLKNVPKSALLSQVEAVQNVVDQVLRSLPADQLESPYPGDVLGYPMTTAHFLLHLHGHLNYHLGQIDYHRRLLTAGKRVEFVN